MSLRRWIRRWRRSPVLWLDLGDLGELLTPSGPHEQWHDHGLGLLRTVLHKAGIQTEIGSTRTAASWDEVAAQLRGFKVLLMNVRSYTFPIAAKAAELFKRDNPQGVVIVGGMHATVALDEMLEVPHFDRICQGPGEGIIAKLVRRPNAFPRVVKGVGAKSMEEWPRIDRTLWPRSPRQELTQSWPLEPACGWGPPPVATIMTSRVCPWQCSFCNENAYIPNMGRSAPGAVVDELNDLDARFGVGSVVIHDSMFFQNPRWLKEWLGVYSERAIKRWPYWAAGRADTVRQWPDLFEALVEETNWSTISIGFESGSDRVLRILNKECTEEDNHFVIDLVNRIGDTRVKHGREPPRFWANIILGIPGETREDAFKTMRMLKRMRYVMPTIAFFAPYPGSILGFQLMAEGKSRMTKDNYHRFPDDEKVVGVDYVFYRDLIAGKYDDEVNRGLTPSERRSEPNVAESLTKA